MKISELKKIAAARTKGDIFERTYGNTDFIVMADTHFDALLEVAEAAYAYAACTGHSVDCDYYGRYEPLYCSCGFAELEGGIARLTDLASGKG